MLKDIKGVIFDMDGTLIDSMWMWKTIDIEYLNRFNAVLPEDLQSKIEGMSFRETAEYFKARFQIKDPIEQIQKEWNRMAWQKYMEEVTLKDGVEEFLEYLYHHEIPCGIASSNSKELIELIVKRFGIKKYFKSIRNSCEVKKGKPSPDIFLLVAEDIGVSPGNCLVFEDVLQGVLGGKRAKMKVCNVYDENAEADTHAIKKHADYFIRSFKEILLHTYERTMRQPGGKNV